MLHGDTPQTDLTSLPVKRTAPDWELNHPTEKDPTSFFHHGGDEMSRLTSFSLALVAFVQFGLVIVTPPRIQAEEWAVRKTRGVLRVVDLQEPHVSTMLN